MRFVCNLEEAMMDVCREYGLEPQRSEGETGTWIGDQKIGAIGVRFWALGLQPWHRLCGRTI